ncbi:hypothetical protein D3C87_1916880 [compost metagenome]
MITDNSGVMILVESNRPPKPTSIIAMSTFSSAKKEKAMATVASKKDGLTSSMIVRC